MISRPHATKIIVMGWLMFIGVAAAQLGAARQQAHHGDLATYLQTSRSLFDEPSRSLYSSNAEYVYPPFLAIALYLLTGAPFEMAGWIWDGVRFASLAVALWSVYRLVLPRVGRETAALIAVCAGMVCIRSAWHDSLRGNVNAILALGLVMGWRAFVESGAIRAGVWWGLVTAVKPSSALLLLTVILCGRKSVARCWIAAAIVFAATNIVLPGLLLGSRATYTQWADYPRALSAVPEVYTKYGNQSLGLSLARVESRITSGQATKDLRNLGLWRLLANTAMVSWSAVLLWRSRRDEPMMRASIAVSCGCLLSVLASPLVWYSHYLQLIPPYVTLILGAWRATVRWRRYAVVATVVIAAGMILGKATILNTVAWAPLCLFAGLTLIALDAAAAPTAPSGKEGKRDDQSEAGRDCPVQSLSRSSLGT